MRSSCYFLKYDFERSIADGETALCLDPKIITNPSSRFFINDLTGAYKGQGDFYLNNKDFDKAIASFTNAIKYAPDYYPFYIARGLAYFNKGDYDRAIADYTQALRLGSNDVTAYLNRGTAYYNKKNYDRAVTDFEAALRIDPNNANTKQWLDVVRKARGR